MNEACPILIKDLSVAYNNNKIIEDINLEIKSGEIFGLIGLNGAGKTTLIRAILGLKKSSGHALIFGFDSKESKTRKNLAYLPEKFLPSQNLTGFEYLDLLFAAYNLKLDKDRTLSLANDFAFNQDFLSCRISSYSKGMAQKLGIMGVFSLDLPLLILDEPMSGLDPVARAKLKDCMKNYTNNSKTIFFTSHIPTDVEELCSRIAVISHKNLVFSGRPQDFIAQNHAENLEKALIKISL